MELFDYSALEQTGKRCKGTISAASAREARAELRARQLSPLELVPARRKQRQLLPAFAPRVRNADLVRATRQLAFLLEGGMAVENALKNTASQFPKSPLRPQMLDVRSQVLDGKPLSAALQVHPLTFDGAFIATVLAGETSGRLAQSFNGLSTRLEAARKLRGKVIAALAYPTILSVVALSVVMILMVFVVPGVVTQFDSFGQQLPLLTRVVVDIANWLGQYGLIALAALVLLVGGSWRWSRSKTGQAQLHGLYLRLPVIGRFVRELDAARFARTMSGLLTSGTALLPALLAAASSIHNVAIRQAVCVMETQLREGTSLHRAMAGTSMFPDIVVQMVAAGESSGKLAASFAKTAEFLETEFENTSSVLLSLLEPFILVLLGGVVLLIIAAIFLPILRLNTLIL